MEQGYIKIRENEANQLIVEAKIVNCNHWMTKYEIADLFNVVIGSVTNTIRLIFNSGILKEENVTRVHKYDVNGRPNEVVLYNLEAIIHIGFRTASLEGKAFREWVYAGFTEFLRMEKQQSSNTLIVLNNNFKVPFIVSLN